LIVEQLYKLFVMEGGFSDGLKFMCGNDVSPVELIFAFRYVVDVIDISKFVHVQSFFVFSTEAYFIGLH